MSKNQDTSISNRHGSLTSELMLYIYFASGVCALIYGIIFYRLLGLSFGNEVYTSGIIVFVLLSGMALGSLIMRKYADVIQKRLRLYAILELLTAVSALLIPIIHKLVDNIYKQFFIQVNPSKPALFIAQVTGALILLLIPAVLTGSTFPLAARIVRGIKNNTEQTVCRLYASKMLGAAVGCFLASFILIRTAGITGTLYIAVVLNVIVALSAWLLSYSGNISYQPAGRSDESAGKQQPLLFIIAILFGGLITAGYIPVWIRSMTTLAGGSAYMVLAILTVYLAGNGIGVIIGSRISVRTKQPAVIFATGLVCIGILGIFYINWLDIWHTGVVFAFVRATAEFWQTNPNRIILYPLFTGFMIFIIPAVISGILFPYALRIFSENNGRTGRQTANLFTVNIFGAALGVAFAVFLLVPLSGIQSSAMLFGLPGIWLGSTMIFVFLARGRNILRLSSLALAAGLTVIAFMFPSDLFTRHFIKVHRQGSKTVAFKEGVNASVSVHRDIRDDLILVSAGIQIASDNRDYRISQKLSGHMGSLLHRNVKQVLVTGFGSGEAASCIIGHGAENFDIAEISRELVDLSLKYFNGINGGKIMFDENADLIYTDPGNYLHITGNNYDLIIANTIYPGKNSLYSMCTKEFFQSALNRLNEGGIFGCIIPLHQIPVSSVNSILGTFKEVFPYITVWMPVTAPSVHDFLFLAGSREKQLFSPVHIDNELKKVTVGKSVKFINFNSSYSLFSCYICDQDGLKNFPEEYEVNSDNNPFVEFNTDIAEKGLVKKQWLAGFLKNTRQDNVTEKIDWSGMTEEEQLEWNVQNGKYYGVADILLNARIETELLSILENCFFGQFMLPGNISLIEQEIYALDNIYMLIQSNPQYAGYVVKKSDVSLQQIPAFGNMWLVRSWALYKQEDKEEAVYAGENAVRYYPESPETQFNLGSLLMESHELNRAIIHLKEAVNLDPENLIYRSKLVNAYFIGSKYDNGISELNKIIEIDPYNYKAYYSLGEFYSMLGKNTEAIRAYGIALKIKPDFDLAKNKIKTLTEQ